MRGILALVGVLFVVAYPMRAEAKAARCEVSSEGRKYVGPCNFDGYKGSFDFEIPKAAAAKFGTHLFHMDITSPGKGDFYTDWVGRGRKFEENMVREKKKPACWSGSLWRACIY